MLEMGETDKNEEIINQMASKKRKPILFGYLAKTQTV